MGAFYMRLKKKVKNALRPKQTTMFGVPEEPEPQPPAVIRLEFGSSPIRVIKIDDEPWWILSDLAKALGYRDAEQASRLVKDHHKGTTISGTPGVTHGMTIVSEGGMYRLIMKSRSPRADEFQDWVTDEVLPTIRKTGRYVAPGAKADQEWLDARQRNREQNKKDNESLFNSGGGGHHIAAHYNAIYRGLTGLTAKGLRSVLGLKGQKTPLDRYGVIPLNADTLTKAITRRLRDDAEKAGKPIPLKDLPKINEAKAREVRARVLASLGGEYKFNVVDGPDGLTLDVEEKSLGNPDRLALGHSQ